MTEKIEGTMVIDGLVQGRLGNREDAETRLRNWCADARRENLLFNLEIEGGTFSLLADNRPILAGPFGPEPSDRIAEILESLIEAFPPSQTGISCTVRSVEYRHGEEVQTIYATTPNGRVQPQQRFVAAQTTPPPQPMPLRQKLKIAGIGLVLVAAILGVLSLFVDYGDLMNRLIRNVVPLDPAKVQVDTGAFSPYFVVEKKAKADGGGLQLHLRRTDAFPRTIADCQRLAEESKTLPKKLAAEDMARGYVRIEYFDEKNQCIGSVQMRIVELRDKEQLPITVPINDTHKPARLVFVE